MYRILGIFYRNSSFTATNTDLMMPNGSCSGDMFFNASSDLGLAPFRIAQRNQDLIFFYNCTWPPWRRPRFWTPVSCAACANGSSNSFAWLAAGRYKPDVAWKSLPGNCTVSMVPVLGYEGATGADYRRLMNGGFLLEYTDYGICEACIDSGGQCRVNASSDEFQCRCSNGTAGDSFICSGEYVVYYAYDLLVVCSASYCYIRLVLPPLYSTRTSVRKLSLYVHPSSQFILIFFLSTLETRLLNKHLILFYFFSSMPIKLG